MSHNPSEDDVEETEDPDVETEPTLGATVVFKGPRSREEWESRGENDE